MYYFQLLAAIKLRLIFLLGFVLFISCATDSIEERVDTNTEDPSVIEQQVPEKLDPIDDVVMDGDMNDDKDKNTPEEIPLNPDVNPKNPEASTPTTPETPVVAAPVQNTDAQKMLELVNAFRKNEGVPPVILSNPLNTAAFKHSKDMESNNYFDHTGKDGSSFGERVRREDYEGFAFGENIAQGSGANQIFELWKDSSGHRKNMLNPNVNEMGVGKSGRYWTQIFGKK
ncbi:CAP domain-containing protein [Aquimarina agarivorans]|uniref:CAP domain-containing protein n=1 Tax=Aquimarina agarivorans TaxID=980584 RepID=UPI000248FD89|nr:CAP domain-containing protein [Aquimarina agarivorans]